MKKNILLMSSLALNIVLAIALIHHTRLSKSSDAERADALKKVDELQREVAKLDRTKAQVVSDNSAKAEGPPPPQQIIEPGFSRTLPTATQTLSKMLEAAHDPNTNKLVMQCVEAMQNRQYSTLFSHLHLPPAQLSQLQELLAQHFIYTLELTQQSKLQNLPINTELVKQSELQFETQTQQMLGPTAASLVEDAVTHPSAWTQLSEYQTTLNASGLGNLSDEQFSATLDALEANLQRVPANVTKEDLDSILSGKTQRNNATIDSLKNILTPEQTKILATQLSDNIAQVRLNFIMSH